MRKKIAKSLLITGSFVAAVSLFTSCSSSKAMLREMLDNRAHLFYELTTPEYTGEVKNNIYLNFIDYSNMAYYTTMKKKGFVVVPLFFYNYTSTRFEAALGERSLTINFREFLTEALLTECNTSTCFNLIDNQQNIAPDSALVLDVRIMKNLTKGKMKLRDTAIFTGYLDLILGHDEEDAIFPMFAGKTNNKVYPAITELIVKVTLSRKNEPLLEKEYKVNRGYRSASGGYGDTYITNSVCLDLMAESLSLATKEMVEEISRELHLLMLASMEGERQFLPLSVNSGLESGD
ncbi:hypothetical protein LJC72_06340 [Bacteroides sp. OttesenSCG-928-D19]|nr:hypothetical protein [Bacteroides sp. OttesenSCG-928-N06]MDL2304942.1 hypothetical protein [Bacteroides sp. OttesenSCG-928-D19]